MVILDGHHTVIPEGDVVAELVRDSFEAVVDRFLTTGEVATRYRTADSTVRYWRHTGTGPCGVKIGTRVLYRESELIRWEQEREAAQAQDGTGR